MPAYKKSRNLPEPPADAADCVVELFRTDDKPRIGRELGELGVFVSREDMQADHEWFRVRLSTKSRIGARWNGSSWIGSRSRGALRCRRGLKPAM